MKAAEVILTRKENQIFPNGSKPVNQFRQNPYLMLWQDQGLVHQRKTKNASLEVQMSQL